MTHNYAKEALKKSIAQLSQNIGWHAIHSYSLDILVDVLQRFLVEVSKTVQSYSVQYNRTEANLDDLGLAFRDLGITLPDIEEYVNNVEPIPFGHKTAPFPVQRSSNLQQLKQESRDSLRPDYIPEYLPPLHPELEEDGPFAQHSGDGIKKVSLDSCDSHSPHSSPRHGLKRPDWPIESSSKKLRFYSEEEGRPMREVTSVFMTPAGFVSPIHEGKSAEASLPILVDSPPPTPEVPSHSKKDGKSKDSKKDKSKSKKEKDIGKKKDLKKVKSSKKEKENKENTNKHDKLSLPPSTSSASSKKEHKSSKSDKAAKSEVQPKPSKSSKVDKMKLKSSHKEEMRKFKDSLKMKTSKSKLKHTGGSGSSHMKSSSSKKLKAAKITKTIKHLKAGKVKMTPIIAPPVLPPLVLPPPQTVPKEVPPPPIPAPPPPEPKPPVVEPKVPEKMEVVADLDDDDDLDFREESPERLVIDDSLETQARQEKESRLEVIDSCIDAVIRRGESEVENQQAEDIIDSVAKGPPQLMMRKQDIYAFTDTSDSSSLSCDDLDLVPPPKKDKKAKKDKQKKKKARTKSPSPYSPPPKGGPKSSFMLRVDDRTPSPILKDDLLSSDEGSTPSSSPRSSSYFDQSPQPAPSMAPPFIPGGSSYLPSPFAAVRPTPGGPLQSAFPTPPLFVTPSRGDSSFQQPLNLVRPLDTPKEYPDLIKKGAVFDKSKSKERKDKGKKKGKKVIEKPKEDIKDKPKPKEKIKAKAIKPDKKKSKPEKKKAKDDKVKEDSMVPKMTLKLSGEPGSAKIFVKPNTKNSTSLYSSADEDNEEEDEDFSITAAPSPPRNPTPPPPVVESPPPPIKETTPPPTKPAAKTTPTRGRGRGRKPANVVASVPPARTVITETLGTIVDESGNKIWICPACSRADDGSPMIGCDECDDWYHWVCVGIVVPPKEEEQWFCVRCIAKRQGPKVKRGKKHKKK